ncbi:hypothetical protein [Paenarthrobacter sp. NCHU4564]|uniref:hypothetical protein n=1 Tax=Paenarthrobacter sp. NCHU4564 TaxID=3451353 RepID=UPI003F999D91
MVRFILAIIMIPAAIGSFIMLSAAIVSLNWIVLISGLVWTPLFAAAPSLGFEAARDGRKARKARKLNGLPKPQTSVDDEAARRYFTKHKEPGLEITQGTSLTPNGEHVDRELSRRGVPVSRKWTG